MNVPHLPCMQKPGYGDLSPALSHKHSCLVNISFAFLRTPTPLHWSFLPLWTIRYNIKKLVNLQFIKPTVRDRSIITEIDGLLKEWNGLLKIRSNF